MRSKNRPLLLRALLWRRGASAVTLVVAALVVASAAMAPIYARAAGESVLRDRLTTSPVDQTGLAYEVAVTPGDPAALASMLELLDEPGTSTGFPSRILALRAVTQVSPIPVDGEPAPRVATQVLWREDVCEHVTLVAGRCPSGPGELAISARTVEDHDEWSLGATTQLPDLTVLDGSDGGAAEPVPMTGEVVGVYRPTSVDDPYWFGRSYFNSHPYTGRGDGPDTVDAFLTARETFDALEPTSDAWLTADYPLAVEGIRLDDVPALRAVVAAAETGTAATNGIDVYSGLTGVLNRTEEELHLLAVAALVVGLQLALLAGLVLFQVVADTTEARGNEVALAKLRGLPPRSTLALALSEPLVLLLLAVPLGLVVAWAGCVAMAATFLLPNTPVIVPAAAWVSVLVAFVGGAVAAALAARRTLTRPVLEQFSAAASARSPRSLLVIDVVVAATAVLAFVALAVVGRGSGGDGGEGATSPDPAVGVAGALALLTPGLLVLAVSLLGVRLVPILGRAGLGPTRGSRHVGLFLAIRQVVRRPAGARLAALLAVALGLATFAVSAESVAAANRESRAALELGSAQVLSVSYEASHDPVEITRRVDPDGRWAMAAAQWLPYGGDVGGTVLAVDTPRMAAVSLWSDTGTGIPASTATADVAPPLPPPVVVRGDAVRLELRDVRFTGEAPVVTVLVQDEAGYHLLQTRPLTPGTGEYEAAAPCLAGCQLLQVNLDRRQIYDSPLRAEVTYAGMQERRDGTWRPLATGFSDPGAWRPTPLVGISSPNNPAVVDGVLRDEIATQRGETPSIQHADAPLPLPALATPGSVTQVGPGADSRLPFMEDSAGREIPLDLVQQPVRLPVVGGNGLLVDLANLDATVIGSRTEARWSVWLGDEAPDDAVTRLTEAGLLVNSTATFADRVDLLGRQGPALALRLLLVCAVAGATLAAGAVALAVALTARRRSFELAALAAVGVRRRSLFTACVGEQGIVLGAGLIVGVPAGVLAARLTSAVIPQFADPTPALLTVVPAAAPVAALALAATALVSVTAWLAGLAVMRGAVPARLREAER